MAQTFESRRLRLQRTADHALEASHQALARAIGVIVQGHATARNEAGEAIVPNTRSARSRLSVEIWRRTLKPYYIGPDADPFVGPSPQSPYARLLRRSIEQAIRIQAEQQAALLNRVIQDEMVLAWLTGPRALPPIREQRGVYDPFHTWVDPNGYRLSGRVWRAGLEVRSRIDALLDYHVSAGTSAVRIAALLEDFLTPGGRLARTRTPYGREGSYAARRLARTEITAASGRATINASIANPFVMGVQWVLSNAHRHVDDCDFNANGGPNGDGIYAPDRVPRYPNHPHEMCHLRPALITDPATVVDQLRAEIFAGTPQAQAMRGLFNPEWLTQAILLGFFDEAIAPLAAGPLGEEEEADGALESL